jgi:glycosyltransferase involved in cell wall biosynthesis
MSNFSFIIPCYNCEKFILQNFIKLKKKLDNSKIKYEIILINDGSSDQTQKIINFISSKYRNIKPLQNERNIGKSFSTIKGIKKSKFQNVVIIDCDLPYFNSLNKIINGLKKGFDLVTINRKLKESKLINKKINLYQIIRYLLGALIAYINIKILGLKIKGGDSQAGLKGFKKNKIFHKAKFISKKFFFDLELILLFSKNNLEILSVKTNYTIPKNSSIKIFNISKNLLILKELFNIIKKYK